MPLEKQAADAASRLLDQGVLGSLVVLLMAALVGIFILWMRSSAKCSEVERQSAEARNTLQETRIAETVKREATLSQLLSESASSNVERARALEDITETVGKVAIGFEMLTADIKSNRERWIDRASSIEQWQSKLEASQAAIVKQLSELQNEVVRLASRIASK